MPLIGDHDLAAISKSISVTATDVFVYDTRKDSDGGAWRKRTQHTSWYNETLNTSTRGSRKEFPAVAIFVTESQHKLTIYDGDDPDMPMWMVFTFPNNSNQSNLRGTSKGICKISSYSSYTYIESVRILNGQMFIGARNESGNYSCGWEANFINEEMYEHIIYPESTTRAAKWRCTGTIQERNDGNQSNVYTTRYDGVNSTASSGRYLNGGHTPGVLDGVLDVAMTVLPNEPIDETTGLPAPTIACATREGISIIKRNEKMISIKQGNADFNDISKIEFNKNNQIVATYSWTGATDDLHTLILDIPTTNTTTGGGGTHLDTYNYNYNSTANLPPFLIPYASHTSSLGNIKLAADKYMYGGNKSGIATLNTETPGFVNHISSSYNTGWMPGDIRLAVMMSNDDTNLTGGNLITNGTFDSDSNWTKSATGNETITISGGTATIAKNGGGSNAWIAQSITTTVGEYYTLSYDVVTGGDSTNLLIGTTGNNSQDILADGYKTKTSGTYTWTFKATATTTYITILQGGGADSHTVDNVIVTLSEKDRSNAGHHQNYTKNDMHVFGTISKGAIHTGKDLMYYSGGTSSNYLYIKDNDILDLGNIGTGDFTFIWWGRNTSSGDRTILYGGSSQLNIWGYGNYLKFYVAGFNNSSTVFNDDSRWRQIAFVRKNQILYVYADGELLNSGAATTDVDLPYLKLFSGYYTGSGHSLSMFRFSRSSISAEQIKQIYLDERSLFLDPSDTTIYGSSDQVTAVAYDDGTNHLHVGTSSGRSVFQGLKRIDNTTDAVGVAISASNGIVAEE